jgi:hypothetical protein
MHQLALFTITQEVRQYKWGAELVTVCTWWDGYFEVLSHISL